MSYLVNKLNACSPYWSMFSRVLAAITGGYVLATANSIFISQLLLSSVGKYQAIHIGLMLTFITYACVAMWVFSVSTATKVWLGLIKLTVLVAVATWLLMKLNGMSS